MDNLMMGVKDYKSINRAAIEINRINVVTGVNGCGKSTLSKILYSFLVANSKKRKDLILEILVNEVNGIIRYLKSISNEEILLNHFSIHDSYDEIFDNYNRLFRIALDFEDSTDGRKSKLYDNIVDKFNEINKLFIDEGFSEDYLFTQSMIYDMDQFLDHIVFTGNSVSLEIENKITDVAILYYDYEFLESEAQYVTSRMETVTHDLMNLVFGEKGAHDSIKIMLEILDREFLGDAKNLAFFIGEEREQSSLVTFEHFFENGFIDNVFYVDCVSLLDLRYSYPGIIMHVTDLFNNLDKFEPKTINDETQFILEKIEDILKSSCNKMDFYNNWFSTEISMPEEDYSYGLSENIYSDLDGDSEEESAQTIYNISSGIKQMGIIRMLLGNNKLNEGSYLIIDEPEVNLHPEWQFKFAEILVLLAKDLKVNVYLNSHSPFFVEAIDAFTEFYDMQDEINYFLAVKSENECKYDFTKISSNELYRIYDNLGRPHDLIDQLRLQKHLNE